MKSLGNKGASHHPDKGVGPIEGSVKLVKGEGSKSTQKIIAYPRWPTGRTRREKNPHPPTAFSNSYVPQGEELGKNTRGKNKGTYYVRKKRRRLRLSEGNSGRAGGEERFSYTIVCSREEGDPSTSYRDYSPKNCQKTT